MQRIHGRKIASTIEHGLQFQRDDPEPTALLLGKLAGSLARDVVRGVREELRRGQRPQDLRGRREAAGQPQGHVGLRAHVRERRRVRRVLLQNLCDFLPVCIQSSGTSIEKEKKKKTFLNARSKLPAT